MSEYDYGFEEKTKTFANEYQKLSWEAFKKSGECIFMRHFIEEENTRNKSLEREKQWITKQKR